MPDLGGDVVTVPSQATVRCRWRVTRLPLLGSRIGSYHATDSRPSKGHLATRGTRYSGGQFFPILSQYGDPLVSAQHPSGPIDLLREAVWRLSEQTRDRPRSGVSHDDADDVVGTVATDDAIGFDPIPLLRAMHENGAYVVVMGQVAGIMHGSRELTGDLDLLWDGEVVHADALVAAFTSVSATLSDMDGRSIACDVGAFRWPKVLFNSVLASGDCCSPALPWGSLPIRDFVDRCCVAKADGLEIRFLRRPDLIHMRRAAGRVKDLRRAQELMEKALPTSPSH